MKNIINKYIDNTIIKHLCYMFFIIFISRIIFKMYNTNQKYAFIIIFLIPVLVEVYEFIICYYNGLIPYSKQKKIHSFIDIAVGVIGGLLGMLPKI